eukprot:CAMPEP_0197689222 /NCGR_PEP_ID=MMETSP1338-20131121/106530_1 /TAXON_ID=43686 ORGANISM="Pelagodinium beii, Strain RCC1491" /NCGR_SAMPLE_ID=MMETSP1338 /ASSEMBLY_ACC=CAM_ASM_000754 /LENGTH=141 /DNA_ID=CAMNT_0043271533 /DNA_START=10 /DNA_END=431 /DNA_ORIENTATION=+
MAIQFCNRRLLCSGLAVVLACVAALTLGSPVEASSCPNVPTATNFKLSAYLGPWYEISDSAAFKEFFEKGLQCTVANYTLRGSGNDTYVEVDNYGRYDSPTGPIKRAIGKARQVSGAKLEVRFPGAPVYAPYWVVDLMGDA